MTSVCTDRIQAAVESAALSLGYSSLNHIVKHFVCMFHMCVNPQTEAAHFWKINK